MDKPTTFYERALEQTCASIDQIRPTIAHLKKRLREEQEANWELEQRNAGLETMLRLAGNSNHELSQQNQRFAMQAALTAADIDFLAKQRDGARQRVAELEKLHCAAVYPDWELLPAADADDEPPALIPGSPA